MIAIVFKYPPATAALIRQPQTHPHNEEPEIRNRILWEGVRFLGVGGNWSAQRKPIPIKVGMESANQIHHWLVALVKGKCTSRALNQPASPLEYMCHPDTEQNRPYNIPWSCRGLNQGPTAPQARTLPVCHTTLPLYQPISAQFRQSAPSFCKSWIWPWDVLQNGSFLT